MTSGWMIGASPEIGICYTLPDSIDLIANYQYLFGLGYSNIPHLSYSTLNIGIGVTF